MAVDFWSPSYRAASGDLTVASVKAAAEGATGGNATTFTVTIPAIFTPAK